ncbi:MAG: hypothetical protein N3A61_09030, partial [Ignavibacteria bacterium]|nr:hypothetical protein [Ignavibacteria bacterium]
IVDLQISNVEKLLEEKEIKIQVDEESRDWLARVGFDITFGARPLKRSIQKYLINPLSEEILKGKFISGDTIKVSLGEHGRLIFQK